MRIAKDIQWDIDLKDHESYEDALANCNLPTEMEIPDEIDEEDISDYLSDQTGFCHAGFYLTERT